MWTNMKIITKLQSPQKIATEENFMTRMFLQTIILQKATMITYVA